jgi:hypothetical protein
MSAEIRVRPLRLGFLVEPGDDASVKRVLEVNTCLWGGLFNFIIPVYKSAPQRYRDPYLRNNPTGKKLVEGLLEAFEPDFLVETRSGIAHGLPFPSARVVELSALFSKDHERNTGYGLTLGHVCEALYERVFRFVQKHPPKVRIPIAESRRHELVIAATFGGFGDTPADPESKIAFERLLDASEEKVGAGNFYELFDADVLFPLRVGAYGLHARRRGWWPHPMLFYMDESAGIDVIEFWNLRALGWRIKPLPKTWALLLKSECEAFLRDSIQAYPPPSNVVQHGTFLCSHSCSFDEMQAFVATLSAEDRDGCTIDPRFPRLWDEWSRNVDHASRQEIAYEENQSMEVSTFQAFHDHVSFATVLPDFVNESRELPEHACVNVIESLPGSATVIPAGIPQLEQALLAFGSEVWASSEGIVTIRGPYRATRFWRALTPLNLFRAWMQRCGCTAELSSNGRITTQLIDSVGGLRGVAVIGNQEVIRLLDKMAHGQVEVEVEDDGPQRRRPVRAYVVSRSNMIVQLTRASGGAPEQAKNLLTSLLRVKAIALGMRLQCPECGQTTWYTLAQIDSSLQCDRCLKAFEFRRLTPRGKYGRTGRSGPLPWRTSLKAHTL